MPNTPENWRPETGVNTVNTSNFYKQRIIELNNGNILVAWTGHFDNDGLPDIVGQLFDPLGNLIGGQLELSVGNGFGNGFGTGNPSIVAISDGGFVVSYENKDGFGNGDVRLDEYSPSGNFESGRTVAAGSATSSKRGPWQPDLAVSSSSSLLVVWEDEERNDIYGRIYNPQTNSLGSEFSLITNGGFSSVGIPDATALNNGNYVVTSQRGDHIRYTIVSSSGATILSQQEISGTGQSGEDDSSPDVVALSNGGFVIVWVNEDSPNLAYDYDIQLRLFTSAGTPLGGIQTIVNANSLYDEFFTPTVSALSDGGFMVAWRDGDNNTVNMQRFDSSANSLGSEVTIASGSGVELLQLSDGRIATVYDNGNVQMQIFDPRDAGSVGNSFEWIGTVGDDVHNQGFQDVYAWDGDDTITEHTVNGFDIYAGAGNDLVIEMGSVSVVGETFDGGNGYDTFDFSSSIYNSILNLTTETYKRLGEADTDIVMNFENAIGGSGGDFITGTNKANILSGGAGDDTITGGAGVDTLDGGAGSNDLVIYRDTTTAFDLNLATGITSYFTETAVNFESAIMDEGNNVVIGTNGVNVILGNGGDDTLDGGAGSDYLLGGAGDDRIIYDENDNLDNVLGGEDTDYLIIYNGVAPFSFDLLAHEFEFAELSFALTGGASQRDNYNSDWQRIDRTIWEADGSYSATRFDPVHLYDWAQIDDNYDASGTYTSQFGYNDDGSGWTANFNIPGTIDYIYNYFDTSGQHDYTVGGFDAGQTFLEDTDQNNDFDWTSKYAVNTAAGQADYQYDYYDNRTRSYLDHDQDNIQIYSFQYTFYDVAGDADYYYGEYNDGTPYYFDL